MQNLTWWKSYETMAIEHDIEFLLHPPWFEPRDGHPPTPGDTHSATWDKKSNTCQREPHYIVTCIVGHFLFIILSLNTSDQTVFTISGLHLDLHIICSLEGGSGEGRSSLRVLPVNKNPWWRGSRREAWDWKPKASHWGRWISLMFSIT